MEHLGLESRRVLSKMIQCQFGKNRLNPSTNGWKFTNTLLSFTALTGSKAYEVVAGYDANANTALDPGEVAVVFQKTPKINKNGTPYSPPPGKGDPSYKWIDKIIVVTQNDWTTAREETDGYGGGIYAITHPVAAEIIRAFARGLNSISGASPTEFGVLVNASIIPFPEGLAHPVGANWNTANQAATHRLVLPDGHSLSNKAESSTGIQEMLERILWNHRATLAAAATSSWSSTTIDVEDDNIRFADSDWGEQVHVALGKCRFVGTVEVSLKANPGGGFDVGALKYNGSLYDLYDFAYGSDDIGPIKVKNAARTQAGFASLTSSANPDAGRIFYTKVNIVRDWFEYSESYPP